MRPLLHPTVYWIHHLGASRRPFDQDDIVQAPLINQAVRNCRQRHRRKRLRASLHAFRAEAKLPNPLDQPECGGASRVRAAQPPQMRNGKINAVPGADETEARRTTVGSVTLPINSPFPTRHALIGSSVEPKPDFQTTSLREQPDWPLYCGPLSWVRRFLISRARVTPRIKPRPAPSAVFLKPRPILRPNISPMGMRPYSAGLLPIS